GPRVGPVVISEIMYHPPAAPGSTEAGDLEFIELHNISGGDVMLFDPDHSTNTWRLSRAVEFVFPKNLTLAAESRILVVGFNPQTNAPVLNAFRAAYGLTEATPIFGPYEGRLNNASDTIDLERPDSPEPPPDPDAGFVPYLVVDEVRYADATPWPLAADGVGSSLQRLQGNLYGNDPAHWVAAPPTAGVGYSGGTPPVIASHPVSQTVVAYSSVTFSVTASGMGPFRYQWRFNGVNITGATNMFLTIPSVQPSQAGSYQVVVLNAAGSMASKIAGLNILIPATILQQPESVLVNPGTNVTFRIQASSNTPITYQWRKDGMPLPGKTGTTLSLANVQEADAGFYDVVVTDGIGPVVSTAA
ncbi:MAG TPA: immunoglobulin domain-containing protein, partial [Verrucomicrobiae bacterium]|nr:immunoglobulin domain-containing protein [Verrucomicrobiae bacterium]